MLKVHILTRLRVDVQQWENNCLDLFFAAHPTCHCENIIQCKWDQQSSTKFIKISQLYPNISQSVRNFQNIAISHFEKHFGI